MYYDNYNLISQDYLAHHGVKGMKWGVRHDPERKGTRRSTNKWTVKGARDALQRGDLKNPNTRRAVRDAIKSERAEKKRIKSQGKTQKSSGLVSQFKKNRSESLRKANYQRYSKKNNPISAGIKASKDLHNYRLGTASAVKKQKTGKAKVKTFMKRYANEPVTVIGITGTAQSTRLDYLKGKYPGYGLY